MAKPTVAQDVVPQVQYMFTNPWISYVAAPTKPKLGYDHLPSL